MSGETLSSLSEKSGSYASTTHHQHHLPATLEEAEEDLDEFDEDPNIVVANANRTYLMDSTGARTMPNYVTMPRRPPQGSFGHHDGHHYATYSNRETHRRTAYMQSLGEGTRNQGFTYLSLTLDEVPSVFSCLNSNQT